MSQYARIAGTGSFLPPQIITNEELAKRVETSHDWIVERTGIHQRHIAGPHESASSMALEAAKRAIEAAGTSAQEIDFIIAATATPDNIFPGVACLLQQKMGMMQDCAAFDMTSACAGFIYALSIADQYIKSGMAKNVLVVATEVMSRIVDWNDRRTCILFGDGAGAVVLQPSETPGVRSTHLHANGNYKDLLWVPSALPAQRLPGLEPHVQMQGNEVFRLAVNKLGKSIDEALLVNKIGCEDIDWFVPHQANIRIIQALAKKLNLPREKVIITVDKHANTSAASIPLALDTAVRDGRIKRGDTLLLEAFGAGLAWGSALVNY